MKSIRHLGALAGVLVLSQVGTASADTIHPVQRSAALILIGRGNEQMLGRPAIDDPADPNTNRRVGPGFEQATLTYMVGADKQPYVVVLVMESVYIKDIGPYQVSCSSYKLNDKSAPTQMVARQMLTKNRGDRSALVDNHGRVVGGQLIFVNQSLATDRGKFAHFGADRCAI